MRRAGKEKLGRLKMVVTGAEKLPESLRQDEEKIGVRVYEGYGMTEVGDRGESTRCRKSRDGGSPRAGLGNSNGGGGDKKSFASRGGGDP